MRRPRLTLASQILTLQLVIILGALIVGIFASWWVTRQRLDDEYGHRALVIAQSVAAVPAVSDALTGAGPVPAVQPLAESIRKSSGAAFVVVMDRAGVRLSHPDPTLIGARVDDVGPGLDGQPWIGPDNGSVGPSVRAKAPVFDARGAVVGVVSVGYREEVVRAALTQELPAAAITLGSALALACLGSLFLARHLKRRTFGLEPAEIGRLLEHRDAILHGIREGTIASDLKGRITLINDEASALLDVDAGCVGELVDEALPSGRVRDMLHGEASATDEVVISGDRVLVANRMPVVGRRGVIGHVVTLRDRTELEGVLRELDSVRSLSDALRAQAHEFSNRLHTLAGLIELGRYEEAMGLIMEETASQQELTAALVRRVDNPVIGALLLAKSVVAAERDIDFRLSDSTLVEGDLGEVRGLVTIVGNLLDNAFDAVSALPPGAARTVELTVLVEHATLVIDVRDSGPGVDPALGAAIFDEGVSSKTTSDRQRGLGLALVKQVVHRRGGVIDVVNEGGAVFRVRLPISRAAEAPPSPDTTLVEVGIR